MHWQNVTEENRHNRVLYRRLVPAESAGRPPQVRGKFLFTPANLKADFNTLGANHQFVNGLQSLESQKNRRRAKHGSARIVA
jgi:hypothetical protein